MAIIRVVVNFGDYKKCITISNLLDYSNIRHDVCKLFFKNEKINNCCSEGGNNIWIQVSLLAENGLDKWLFFQLKLTNVNKQFC